MRGVGIEKIGVFHVWASWISSISGGLSVVSIIGATIFKYIEFNGARYWLLAGFLSFTVASVTVWYKDRPRLIVDLENVYAIAIDDKEPDVFITLVIRVTNTKPEKNSIKRHLLSIDGESCTLQPQSYIKRDNKVILQTVENPFVFEQGIVRARYLSFRVKKELLGKPFQLSLTDAYLATHRITGTCPDGWICLCGRLVRLWFAR